MRKILILGAGKSSVALIDYLAEHAGNEQWQITVADITPEQAMLKTKGRDNTGAIGADLTNNEQRKLLIENADIVISMLPAGLHLMVAGDCIQFKKNLVTPSYISDTMRGLEKSVLANDLVFMNEMGLDPGIDHMSAMQIIDRLKSEGKRIAGFQSHCGGLMAPQSDNNKWHYKFTWNPRNVVLAGQGEGGIHYLKDGKHVDLTYAGLFEHAAIVELEGHGTFESYPNRDSLKYIAEYGLEGIKTMYRGTLRKPPFCKGWNLLVKRGLTDANEKLRGLSGKSYDEVIFNPLTQTPQSADVSELLQELQSGKLIPFDEGTKAEVLQSLLETKWGMEPGDKDMIVMVHQINFEEAGVKKCLQSSLVYVGKDSEHTAMAVTVGLPVAIITKMILNGQVKRRGVLMPKYPEIYNPVLEELKEYEIEFREVLY